MVFEDRISDFAVNYYAFSHSQCSSWLPSAKIQMVGYAWTKLTLTNNIVRHALSLLLLSIIHRSFFRKEISTISKAEFHNPSFSMENNRGGSWSKFTKHLWPLTHVFLLKKKKTPMSRGNKATIVTQNINLIITLGN